MDHRRVVQHNNKPEYIVEDMVVVEEGKTCFSVSTAVVVAADDQVF